MAGKDRPQQLDEGTTVGQCHRGLCNVDFSLCIAAPAATEFSADFAPEKPLEGTPRKVLEHVNGSLTASAPALYYP